MHPFQVVLGLALIIVSVIGLRIRFLRSIAPTEPTPAPRSNISGIRAGGVLVESVVSTGDVHMVVDGKGATFRVGKGGTVKGRCNGQPFHFTSRVDNQTFTIGVKE